MKEKIEKVATWLNDYCDNHGFKGFVLGLSGGIDSAVSLGLAVKAVGPDRIKCLSLPCAIESENRRDEDYQDAIMIAEKFGVKLDVKVLSFAAEAIYKMIKNPSKLVLPNIKARLRMITLRAEAEALGYIVLGTTNKTEEYLGYYTKAGDGGAGVDIEPIADFFKYEIRELARELGVPEKIITKAPSAGLWFDQTDEDEIGFKYDDIDRYLSIREEVCLYNPSNDSKIYQKHVLKTNKIEGLDIKWSNLSVYMKENPKVLAARIDPKLIDRVEGMIVSGNHKRVNPPYFDRNKHLDKINFK